MSETRTVENVISARDVRKTFARKGMSNVAALDGVSLDLKKGTLMALVGPDGAGKTTFIRLVTGLMSPDAGTLQVLGLNMPKDAPIVQTKIGYMPQKFGLYEDMTVMENLDLYAALHGVTQEERRTRYAELLSMTALAPFTKRLAGKLSGGMKQKLGLACTLIRSPELLVLDEPTVGVDPLSRRELWEIISNLVSTQSLTVLMSTAYMDEAERCNSVVVLREGRVVTQGTPDSICRMAEGRTFIARPNAGQRARSLQARLIDMPTVTDAVPEGGQVRFVMAENSALPEDATLCENIEKTAPRLEDGFMAVLHKNEAKHVVNEFRLERKFDTASRDVVIRVNDLVRMFGDFAAVNHVSFEVHRGEVFGLLGPNGAGKTTTFRMLCGLLPATSGHLEVAGMDLRMARADARQKLGYVAQKFSLYGNLSVKENLEFFARAYGLHNSRKDRRIEWVANHFELQPLMKLPAEQLAGGFKQRLAMAAALLHEPEILFLDEPTSGADPLARREFWRRITTLSEQGVTVIVTTHFMEEAEYCDHIVIQDAGRVLARGTPAEVRGRAKPVEGRQPTMEDAFIAVVEEGRAKEKRGEAA
jgi:ABC-2 type transport system ATP-binding protein